jgi:hypothetical protein
MFIRKKIPCFVLIFHEVDIIKQSLNFMVKFADRLDLILVENPSPHSPQIGEFTAELGKQSLIKRHYLFETNITGNAMDTVLNKESALIKKSRFMILTDGDLVCDDSDWLDEEIAILDRHPDVLACGVSLDRSNLPLKTFPDAKNWLPDDVAETEHYYETITGCHLLLVGGGDFYDFLNWKNQNDLYSVDGALHQFCYQQKHRKWARTKKAKAYHLTWDLYSDKKHPYTRLKTGKDFKQTWHHRQRASFKLTQY